MAGRLARFWWEAAVLWPAWLMKVALFEVPGRAAGAVLVGLGARRVLRALLAVLGDNMDAPPPGGASPKEVRRLLGELDRARLDVRVRDVELKRHDRQRWRLAAALEQKAEELAELQARAPTPPPDSPDDEEGEDVSVGPGGEVLAPPPCSSGARVFWPLHLAVLLAAALYCRAAERLPSVERKLVLCLAFPLGCAYVGVLKGHVFREATKMLICSLVGFALGLMALSDLHADAAAVVVGSLRPPA